MAEVPPKGLLNTQSYGTVAPYDMNMVQKTQGLLAQGFMKMGYGERDAYTQANKVINTRGGVGGADFTPLVGDLIGAQDTYDMGSSAKDAFNRGEYLKSLGYGAGSAATGILSALGFGATVAPPVDKLIDAARVGVKKATGLLNDVDQLGFYSPTERLAANLQPKGTGQQYLGILSKGDGQGSRIQEEMQDMGLDTWLQSKGKVTRQEIIDYAEANKLRYGKTVQKEGTDAYNKAIAESTADELEMILDNDYGLYQSEAEIRPYIDAYRTSGGTDREAVEWLENYYSRGGYEGTGNGYVDMLERQSRDGLDRGTVEGAPKYQQYSQSGGKDYQENLLTVPENKAKYYQKLQDVMDRYKTPLTDDEVARLSDLEGKFTPNTGDPMKNLELHLRYTRPDGALPNGATRAEWDEFNRLRIKKGKNDVVLSGDYNNFANPEEVKELRALREASGDNYQSPHYDPANIGLTTRTQSFNTNNGNSVHLMDELQSDWHQAGKKKGYRIDAEQEKARLKAEQENIIEEANKYTSVGQDAPTRITDAYTANSNRLAQLEVQEIRGVPNAPAKNSWINQGIKKEINQTIADGKDYFAWTGGDIQADRYSLHHQVERIAYEKNADDTYKLYITPKGSTAALDEVSGQSMKNVKADQLEGIVGKEVAEKITKGKHTIKAQGHDFQDINILDGVDLKVGGEGMKGFYDKDVKKRTEKIIKRLDPKAKVEVIELDNGNKVWGVKITDQMRDKTKTEGMPLYSLAPIAGAGLLAASMNNEQQPQPTGILEY